MKGRMSSCLEIEGLDRVECPLPIVLQESLDAEEVSDEGEEGTDNEVVVELVASVSLSSQSCDISSSFLLLTRIPLGEQHEAGSSPS